MARARISEYKAKHLLVGPAYQGVAVTGSVDTQLDALDPDTRYVAKVDQGVKKRFLQGLIVVDVTPKQARDAIKNWEEVGFSAFLIEPTIPHEQNEERYLSLERVRNGVRIVWMEQGGVNVEEASTEPLVDVVTDLVSCKQFIEAGIPRDLIERALTLIKHEHVSFIEINPLLVVKGEPILLDAAIMVDDAGGFFARAWTEDDLVHDRKQCPEELAVAELQRSTAASLKLSIVNPDGALFFLLSGGGGSIVVLDAAHEQGAGEMIGNYGEYSGGPTREETYLYTHQVLSAMLRSKAPHKALVIAGGVANFTDVLKTFQGVIDALKEHAPKLREAGVKVFVRRGGPNEVVGLAAMEEFLTNEQLLGCVYGSNTPITTSVIEAVAHITSPS